jgi:nucleoside-diphosphate-sugar epimerase
MVENEFLCSNTCEVMLRILVLGSRGQIGEYLVRYLTGKGHDVRGMDLLNGPEEDLRLRPNELLTTELSQADFVFFLAFDVGGSRYLESRQHSFDFLYNNSLLSLNVFEELRRGNKPFIYTSSQMSNMGDSPYGLLKKLGEQFTASIEPLGAIAKFWNVYGVETSPDKSHAITDFVRMAISDQSIRLLTDGSEQRQFLFAADCAIALEILMERFLSGHRVRSSDVSSFEYVSILDVAGKVAEVARSLGFRVSVVPGVKTDVIQGDARNEPSREILEYWKPTVTLEDGISEIFDFFLDQKQVS